MDEGNGWKRVCVTTSFPDSHKAQQMKNFLEGMDLRRTYNVRGIEYRENSIQIIFHDTIGTMKKMESFFLTFFQLLDDAGATKWNVCLHCGQEITDGTWKLIDSAVFHYHRACAVDVEANIRDGEETARLNDDGSYGTGFIGALIGALGGAVVWVLVMLTGYMASAVALLTGVFSEKLYRKFRGKKGGLKILILLICIAIGVVLGTGVGYVAVIFKQGLQEGIPTDWIIEMLPELLAMPEVIEELTRNMLLALFFAVLGGLPLALKTHKEIRGAKIIDLE